jgi:hypothetical protein
MKDVNGRAYATVGATKAGDALEADDGFTCIGKGTRVVVSRDHEGLFVPCRHGQHHLAGQVSTTGSPKNPYYVGLYPAA